MPYEGDAVSIVEMFDVLVAASRSETEAILELARAFEDRAVELHLPDGANDKGEMLYSPVSVLGLEAIIRVLRDFPRRMTTPLTKHPAVATNAFRLARAVRVQFLEACGLKKLTAPVVSSADVPNRRFTSDDILVAEGVDGVRNGVWPNAHQAAIALQPRAEGASPDSTIRRLGEKIRKTAN